MAGREIDRLRHELEDLFNEVWRSPRFARNYFRPAVDAFRTAEPPQLVIIVELAGIDPDHVQVVAREDSIVVSGERRRPRRGKGGQVYQRMEITYGAFECRIPLPDDVETESATARYAHGLLQIVLPIAPHPEPAGPVPIQVNREV